MPCGHSGRECHCRENGGSGARLYSRHAGGAGRAVYQAVLCPPLRQQHQPPDEGHPVRQSSAQKPGVAGAGGRGRADDQGHLRRGRLRGGNAEIHHRGLRHRRGAGGLRRHASGIRLAAGNPEPAVHAGILRLRGVDEAERPACGRGLQKSGGRTQHGHAGSGAERRDLPHLRL